MLAFYPGDSTVVTWNGSAVIWTEIQLMSKGKVKQEQKKQSQVMNAPHSNQAPSVQE